MITVPSYIINNHRVDTRVTYIQGILPIGPYPPCLRMPDRGLLAGYPRYFIQNFSGHRCLRSGANDFIEHGLRDIAKTRGMLSVKRFPCYWWTRISFHTTDSYVKWSRIICELFSDVTWVLMPATWLFVQQFPQTNNIALCWGTQQCSVASLITGNWCKQHFHEDIVYNCSHL